MNKKMIKRLFLILMLPMITGMLGCANGKKNHFGPNPTEDSLDADSPQEHFGPNPTEERCPC